MIGILCADDHANFAFNLSKCVESVAYKLNKHPFNYSEELPLIKLEDIRETYKDCDVILLVHSDWELIQYLPDVTVINYATGTKYRQDYQRINTKFKAPITLIALPEFQYIAPHAKYLVGAIDVNLPDKELGDKLVVGHFPSNPSVKGTMDILRIVQDMNRWHDFKFIYSTDRVSHEENLKRINECDIYIELLASEQGGKPYGSWGISAMEAAAMGKIVITQAINDGGIYADTYGINMLNLVKNEEGLRKTLNGLLNYKGDYIRGQQVLTKDWVRQHHSFEATGKKLKEYLNGL
jgi:hypothetical protein